MDVRCLMENKSRVIKYESLRKKIQNMDVYSFEETPEVAKNIPEVKDFSGSDGKDMTNESIKKNTLSLSLDELIKANDSYEEEKEKEETKKAFKRKEKSRKKQEKKRITIKFWMLLIPIAVILAVVVFFLIKGAL
jgi:cation transport ATPase